jgi:hypothetical protein
MSNMNFAQSLFYRMCHQKENQGLDSLILGTQKY